VGVSDDTRSQHENKKIAFKRMAESHQFKVWHKLEVARRTGALAEAKSYSEREVKSKRVTVEIKKDGRWIKEYDEI
jgi:peroxiredoxin